MHATLHLFSEHFAENYSDKPAPFRCLRLLSIMFRIESLCPTGTVVFSPVHGSSKTHILSRKKGSSFFSAVTVKVVHKFQLSLVSIFSNE